MPDQPEPYVSLLQWMQNEMSIPNEMKHKEAALNQMCFFRERIGTLFLTPDCSEEQRQNIVKVCSWHTSKSIRLPVYYINTAEWCDPRKPIHTVEIIARDNFYNWNVTVIGSRDFDLPDYFTIDSGKDYLFVEGMGSWLRGQYAASRCEFSFCVWSRYELFAIMWCIASQMKEKS